MSSNPAAGAVVKGWQPLWAADKMGRCACHKAREEQFVIKAWVRLGVAVEGLVLLWEGLLFKLIPHLIRGQDWKWRRSLWIGLPEHGTWADREC